MPPAELRSPNDARPLRTVTLGLILSAVVGVEALIILGFALLADRSIL